MYVLYVDVCSIGHFWTKVREQHNTNQSHIHTVLSVTHLPCSAVTHSSPFPLSLSLSLSLQDYGSSDDADGFQYLLRISPVHNVQSDKPYPAVMLTTGDHDDRVVPLHSYKYVSALQHAWAGRAEQKQPLLIRIETKAGHGAGMPLTKRMQEQADVFSFISKASEIKLQWTDEQRQSLKTTTEDDVKA